VEKDYEIEVGATKIVGQVDRVDEHDTGAIRVLDYKTSKSAKNVVGEHLKKFGSELPKHLRNEAVVAPDGKIWRNLQVALYAVALEKVDSVGYFALGEDRANVKIEEWPDFGDSVKDSALHCAEWVIGQIREQVFWPPASQVRYDDFEALALGRHLEEMVNWEGGRA
jgi:ATP-dependent helicase/nuclease subunit B